MTSRTSAIPAAASVEARQHFQSNLQHETDCWDVYQSFLSGMDFVLVDTRAAETYRHGHIPTAHNVAVDAVADFVGRFPAETLFVTYCTGPHCNGADRMAARLAELGRPVKVMLGGMWGWRETGLQVATGGEPGSYDPAIQPPEAPGMTVERLQAFGKAWGEADIETLMTYIADDCVYSASVGPEPGETFRGRDAVRRGFEKLLAHDSDAESRSGDCFVSGEDGFARWSFVYQRDGRPVEVHGCDLFRFRGDKIVLKDAFRKTFP